MGTIWCTRRRSIGPFGLALTATLVGLGLPAAAAAAEPIEGVWSSDAFPGAERLWEEIAPGRFHSTMINGPAACTVGTNGLVYMAGLEGATVTGSGYDYSGTNPFYRTEDCSPTGETGEYIVHIFATDPPTLASCTARPGTGPPDYDTNYEPTDPDTKCSRATFIRPPEPAVDSFDDVVDDGKTPACTKKARKSGRRLRLLLLNPGNEPLRSLLVTMAGKVVLDYAYPGKVPEKARVRIPPKGGKLVVTFETVNDKTFTKKRKFKPCKKRKKKEHHI